MIRSSGGMVLYIFGQQANMQVYTYLIITKGVFAAAGAILIFNSTTQLCQLWSHDCHVTAAIVTVSFDLYGMYITYIVAWTKMVTHPLPSPNLQTGIY